MAPSVSVARRSRGQRRRSGAVDFVRCCAPRANNNNDNRSSCRTATLRQLLLSLFSRMDERGPVDPRSALPNPRHNAGRHHASMRASTFRKESCLRFLRTCELSSKLPLSPCQPPPPQPAAPLSCSSSVLMTSVPSRGRVHHFWAGEGEALSRRTRRPSLPDALPQCPLVYPESQ